MRFTTIEQVSELSPLQRIKGFNPADGRWAPWFDIIKESWHCDYGSIFDEVPGELTLVTGGWSGNEEVISAMKENTMGWIMTWSSSHRGGKYVFELRS